MIALLLFSLGSGVVAAPATWMMTSGEVSFAIDAPLDVIPGTTRRATGSLTLDPDGLSAVAQATVGVDLRSFSTGIELRDEDLRDQFFQADRYPRATLQIGALERLTAPELVDDTPVEAVAVGTLDLHGVSRPVKIPLTITRRDDRITVHGDFVVPLLDFAIERPKRLIFKLGTDVRVKVRGSFTRVVDKAPPPPPDPVALMQPAPLVTLPARLATTKSVPPKWAFAADTAEGRGERAFVDAGVGGPGNIVTCKSCHATHDERQGLAQGGIIKPSSTMWNAARRTSLWQGLAATPGEAAEICARLYMLKDGPLPDPQKQDFDAYLLKLAPDVQPAQDFGAIHLTRRSPVADLHKGDIARGRKLVAVYCADCHDKGRQRPPLEPGLYEADMVVRRVRRLPGSDNQQMPLIPLHRLPDSELRDIVAHLTDEKQRIFVRKKRPAPR